MVAPLLRVCDDDQQVDVTGLGVLFVRMRAKENNLLWMQPLDQAFGNLFQQCRGNVLHDNHFSSTCIRRVRMLTAGTRHRAGGKTVVFVFGECTLDLEQRELRRAAWCVPSSPRRSPCSSIF